MLEFTLTPNTVLGLVVGAILFAFLTGMCAAAMQNTAGWVRMVVAISGVCFFAVTLLLLCPLVVAILRLLR